MHILGLILLISIITIKKCESDKIILDKQECSNKRIQQIDKIVIKFIGMDKNGRKLPTNKEEILSFCKESDRMANEIMKFFSECLNEDASRTSKIFIYSMKRSLKPFCSKKQTTKQQQLVDVAPCFNSIIENIDCLEKFSDKTKALIPYKIGKDKIKYICCNFVDLLKCAEDVLTVPCMNEVGKRVLMNFFHNISGDIINYGCGDYTESTDRCDHLNPPSKSQLDKSIKVNSKIKFFFSILYTIESIEGPSAPL